MRSLTRTLLLLAACGLVNVAAAQTARPPAVEPTATISGRVTVAGEAASGVLVFALQLENMPARANVPVARATTDGEGRYRLTNLPAGRIAVTTHAPTHITPRTPMLAGLHGQMVTVGEGETVENIDFTLTRGGVITGRVTDAEGRPVVGERVNLQPAEVRSQMAMSAFNFQYPFMFQTDDRGIYRLYGLEPGRYRVSVGQTPDGGGYRFGGQGYFQRTFHPNVTEEARAAIVEVTAGGEATGIDIALGRREATYRVAGRIVDAETGQPVPRLGIGYGQLREGRISTASFGTQANERGEFWLENVMPGRYAVILAQMATGNEYHADPAPFEVRDADVTGLVVRVRRGITVSGIVEVEGYSDPAVLSRLSQLYLAAMVQTPQQQFPINARAQIRPDRTFVINNVAPGRLRLFIAGMSRDTQSFRLLRLERDGQEQRDGIEVRQGEAVTGVRLVLAYGTGAVRGQVNIVGGTLPPNTNIYASLLRAGEANPMQGIGGVVDARGRFQIEGVPAGSYELRLMFMQFPSSGPPRAPLSQSINVSDGSVTEANFTLDLRAPENRP